MIGGTKQFVLIALTAFCLAGVSCLAPQALEKIDKEGKFAGEFWRQNFEREFQK